LLCLAACSLAHTAAAQTNSISSSATNTVGLWANGTEYLHIGSTGNVGIDTTSPNTTLQVNGSIMMGTGTCGSSTAGSIQYNGSAIQWCNGTSWNTFAGGGLSGSGTTNYLARWTPNGSTLGIGATYDNGTDVGIGNTSPTNVLSVGPSGNVGQTSAYIQARNAGNSFEWGHSNPAGYASTLGAWVGSGQPFLCFDCEAGTTGNTFKTRGIKGALLESDLAGGFIFATVPTASADNQTATDTMVITTGGNVGIGTTAPGGILQVMGNNNQSQGLLIGNAGQGGNPWFIGREGNTTGRLAVGNGSELVSVLTSGNVGIGTSAPTVPLNVFGAGAFQNIAGFPSSGHGIEIVPNVLSGVDAIQSFNRDTSAWRQLRVEASPLVLNDASGGNVGIGTTAPDGILQVRQASGIDLVILGAVLDTGAISLNAVNDNVTANIPMEFRASSFDFSTGNVGIGTASPTDTLQVYSGQALEGISLRSGASGSYVGYGIGRTSVDGYLGVAGAANEWVTGTAAGDVAFLTANTGKLFLSSEGVQSLVINGGNVGIGTTAPTNVLDVNGGIGVRGNLSASGGAGIFIGYNSSVATIESVNPGVVGTEFDIDGYPTIFKSSNSGQEWARFATNGNVGIGTTAPNSLLTVYQSANAQANGLTVANTVDDATWMWSDVNGVFHFDNGGGGGRAIVFNGSGAGSVGIGTTTPAANGLTINSVTPTVTFELSGTSEESLYDDGSYFYVMSTSGGNGVKLQHGSTLWTSSSDRRIKKDITALPESYGLSAVEALKPVTFHWRDPKSPQQLQMGLIAQDVQQVIPELVTRSGPTRYAPDGELGIEYSGLVIPLIKAVQELKADNDDLKAANDNEAAQIKALTARLDAIEAARAGKSKAVTR
jgi:hypothetical protein